MRAITINNGIVFKVNEGMGSLCLGERERMLVCKAVLGAGFLRHERALKQGLPDLAGEAFDLPGWWRRTVSSPSSSYPSAGCSSAEPASVSLDKLNWLGGGLGDCFPFPFPWGSVEWETGKGPLS